MFTPTRADIVRKGLLAEQGAHNIWFFLAAVIGVCTLVNWTSKALAFFVRPNPPHPDGPTSESATPGRTGAASARRLPAAVAASLRIFAFRCGISTGKGRTVL
jgi:ferric-chelate reductase